MLSRQTIHKLYFHAAATQAKTPLIASAGITKWSLRYHTRDARTRHTATRARKRRTRCCGIEARKRSDRVVPNIEAE